MPRTDDFSRRRTTKHLTAKVVSTGRFNSNYFFLFNEKLIIIFL